MSLHLSHSIPWSILVDTYTVLHTWSSNRHRSPIPCPDPIPYLSSIKHFINKFAKTIRQFEQTEKQKFPLPIAHVSNKQRKKQQHQHKREQSQQRQAERYVSSRADSDSDSQSDDDFRRARFHHTPCPSCPSSYCGYYCDCRSPTHYSDMNRIKHVIYTNNISALTHMIAHENIPFEHLRVNYTGNMWLMNYIVDIILCLYIHLNLNVALANIIETPPDTIEQQQQKIWKKLEETLCSPLNSTHHNHVIPILLPHDLLPIIASYVDIDIYYPPLPPRREYTERLDILIRDQIVQQNDATYDDYPTQAFLRDYFTDDYRLKDANQAHELSKHLFRVLYQISLYSSYHAHTVNWEYEIADVLYNTIYRYKGYTTWMSREQIYPQ